VLAMARITLNEPERARYHAEKAVALSPNDVGAHLALAQITLKTGDLKIAEKHARRAVEISPNRAEAWEVLGVGLRTTADRSESKAAYLRAFEIDPKRANVAVQVRTFELEDGRVHEATDALRQIALDNPKHFPAQQKFAYALIHDERSKAGEIKDAHAAWGRLMEAGLGQIDARTRDAGRDMSPDRPLTIGYLSPDLRRHSVTSFLLPLLEHHDKDAVRVIAYATNKNTDDVSERIKTLCAGWRSVAETPDGDIAKMIIDDKVDVLVDLCGHFALQRLGVFARKPAPVQVTYLGYPATTGLTRIDARLVDATTDPESLGDAATERLVRLEGCFLCFGGPHDDADPEPSPNYERNGAFRFGSFNNVKKVGPAVLDAWAQVLMRCPDASLKLKGRGYDDDDASTRITTEFESRGVDPSRVTFAPRTESVAEHLREYADVDVALDTFPYNGTTTTCEASWMGVPTLTIAGAHHAARVSASLNAAMGLKGFTTESAEAYIERAASIANDPSELNELRPTLRERMTSSRLMNGAAHARAVESAYRSLWQAFVERSGGG